MKNALLGVVHPISINYFDEYLSSINNQTFKDFKLFIFGDRIEYQYVRLLLEKYDKLDIVYNELDRNLSISKARQKALEYLKEKNFDTCIFTDTDDFYHTDYVKFLVKYLSGNHHIVFSDLSIYFSDENKIDNYFKKYGVPDEIGLQYIFEKNCIGLGHSGIKLDLYERNEFVFPDDVIAVDWWLYSVLMERKGCKAYFINKSLVNYRQHESNTAGFLKLDEKRILYGLKVKVLHYKNLVTFDKKYEKSYEHFNNLYDELSNDEGFRKKYVKYICSFYKNRLYLWWEYAKSCASLEMNKLN